MRKQISFNHHHDACGNTVAIWPFWLKAFMHLKLSFSHPPGFRKPPCSTTQVESYHLQCLCIVGCAAMLWAVGLSLGKRGVPGSFTAPALLRGTGHKGAPALRVEPGIFNAQAMLGSFVTLAGYRAFLCAGLAMLRHLNVRVVVMVRIQGIGHVGDAAG